MGGDRKHRGRPKSPREHSGPTAARRQQQQKKQQQQKQPQKSKEKQKEKTKETAPPQTPPAPPSPTTEHEDAAAAAAVEDEAAGEDALEIAERVVSTPSVMFARVIRALREIPPDAELQAGATAAKDPLRAQLDECAGMLGRAFIFDESGVPITDEVLALWQVCAFTGADTAELRQVFSNKYVRKLPELPETGGILSLSEAEGDPFFDMKAYDRRDVLVGKGTFAGLMLLRSGKPRAALALFDELIRCVRAHQAIHLTQAQRYQLMQQQQAEEQQQQQQQQQAEEQQQQSAGKGKGSKGKSKAAPQPNYCKCPNDEYVLTRLLEFRSACHRELGAYSKAKKDLTTAISLGGYADEYMQRALLVFPVGLESGWKESSIDDLREYIECVRYLMPWCPCTRLYISSVKEVPAAAQSSTFNAPGTRTKFEWPKVPENLDEVVRWSVRTPSLISTVTGLLLGHGTRRRTLTETEAAAVEAAAAAVVLPTRPRAKEGKCKKFSRNDIKDWGQCVLTHDGLYKAYMALSVLLSSGGERPTTAGLHVYLLAQIENRAMTFHQFFRNAALELEDRARKGQDAESMSLSECVESWLEHWSEFPQCNTHSDIQQRAHKIYHGLRPCVVCRRPTKLVCSHCHAMPVCTQECLQQVWAEHKTTWQSHQQELQSPVSSPVSYSSSWSSASSYSSSSSPYVTEDEGTGES